MPCYHPREAWLSATTNPSGKRSLVFDRLKGLSTHPVTVPCGGCIGCRLDRAHEWSMRIMHEKTFHELSSFVTLTYDDQHLPANGSINIRDTQRFLKKLRSYHAFHNNDAKIRFFLCGEYGEQFSRPHYHAILFGIDFSDKKQITTNKQQQPLYRSPILEKLWENGHTYTGAVTKQSAEYVARYIVKKVTGDKAEQHYQGKTPEFITMSRRPGIGKLHYEKYKTDIYSRDFCTTKGKKTRVPRYYDRLLDKEDPSRLQTLKKKRIQRAIEPQNKYENSPERLAIREEVRLARITNLKRDFQHD